MSTVSTRFPYKERRVGKITEIALTRLTSTPSNPYGSKAKACQPQPVISAAWQGWARHLFEGANRKNKGGYESAPGHPRPPLFFIVFFPIGRETGV